VAHKIVFEHYLDDVTVKICSTEVTTQERNRHVASIAQKWKTARAVLRELCAAYDL